MINAHTHVESQDSICILAEPCEGEVRFVGFHPWHLESFDIEDLRNRLAANQYLGVGEIGLDRLRDRNISRAMREAFSAQLSLAAEFHRPVVLHGAKCWGEVVKGCVPYKGIIPSFLFHGFSRSAGLIPDIVSLNGFISVGPAILNDHAVNYREMVKKLPEDIILVETDATAETFVSCPPLQEVVQALANVRGLSFGAMAEILERNAARMFMSILHGE